MCFYAVMKLRWKPSEYAFLPPAERALMNAFIKEMLEQEAKTRKKSGGKKPSRSGRRRR